MPLRDGTGPQGMGPRTGRGLGWCDMGRRETAVSPTPDAPGKTSVYYPSITLNADKLAALADAKVDDQVEIVIKGVVKEVGRRSYGNKELYCDIEIRQAGVAQAAKTLKELYSRVGETSA